MLVSCWSIKGGSGVSVIAAALACALAADRGGPEAGSLLVDLDGDAAAVLGVVGGAHGSAQPPDEIEVFPGLGLLSFGDPRPTDVESIDALTTTLTLEARTVVVDCGLVASTEGAVEGLAASATLSLLVIRPCYLALRRAMRVGVQPSGVIVVREPGRALRTSDVADVLGAPVLAEVPFERSVARAVDAGLLARRMPVGLARALQPVVDRVLG